MPDNGMDKIRLSPRFAKYLCKYAVPVLMTVVGTSYRTSTYCLSCRLLYELDLAPETLLINAGQRSANNQSHWGTSLRTQI